MVRRQGLNQQIHGIEDKVRENSQEVLNRFVRARVVVAQEEAQAVASHEAAIQDIRVKLQLEQARIDADYRKMKAQLAPARKEQEQKLVDLNRRTTEQRFEVCKLEKDLERYRRLSPLHYTARMLGLRRAG